MIKRALSRATALAGGTAATLAVTALLAAPAQATSTVWNTWDNLAYADQCLDGSASQGVRLNTCNGSTYQKWDYFWDASAQIRHYQSGRCLDGSVTQGVRLVACNGSSYQKWRPTLTTGEIRHVQSGRCLDGSVTQGVRLVACNGGIYQQWA
ncbi:RICIN domain-containing protein [Streptomyces sp. NPDC086783]|uniref:RICIN domain-containing protein n=1 Tax=Streptomyces sp. NPDC086783 TaxID=3365758 RepID=UPI00381F693A